MNVHRIAWLAMLCAGVVQASSDEAWKAQEQLQRERCLAASQLQSPKLLGQPVLFDDSVGYTALLIGGRYPQAHMKGTMGRELCLYERKTGKAAISEADSLLPMK